MCLSGAAGVSLVCQDEENMHNMQLFLYLRQHFTFANIESDKSQNKTPSKVRTGGTFIPSRTPFMNDDRLADGSLWDSGVWKCNAFTRLK